MIVIIPSNRDIRLDYFQPLLDTGARFIVVDDSEGSLKIDHPQFRVVTWKDQERMLGTDQIAIPRRNGACRDFGFYVAWKESDDDEIIVALDDDCKVEYSDFGERVAAVLSDKQRPVAKGQGRHFNALDCYSNIESDVYPRGFPYADRATYQPWELVEEPHPEVLFNLGLWRGIFDVNAIDKIKGPAYTYDDAKLKVPSAIAPEGSLISVCSMNMHFRRKVIPAAYNFLMHVPVMPGWVVDRYGDIWGGFLLKTLMDINGDAMSVGEPMIRHLKEGNYTRNIWQEHTCHLLNDEFLELLEQIREEVNPDTYVNIVSQATDVLDRGRESASELLRRYLDVQVPGLRAWVRILS